MALNKKKKLEPEEKQFPAKSGDVQVEIDKRSPDGSETDTFVKVMRIQMDSKNITDEQHERNKDVVLEEAIQRGLHAKEEVQHVSTELSKTSRRGVKTYDVTYSVVVVPASIDTIPATTLTPTLDDKSDVTPEQ